MSSNRVGCERKKNGMANLVFLPMPGMGHLVSMVELAKTILQYPKTNKNHQFAVTILVLPQIQPSPQTSAYIASVEADSGLHISFIHLLQMDPSQIPNATNPSQIMSVIVDFIRPHVASALTDLIKDSSAETTVAALIVDMFLVHIGDVANDLGVDFYMFFTSSLSMLGFMLFSPTIYDGLPTGKGMFELEEDESVEIRLPGFSCPIPVTALPDPIFQSKEEHAKWLKSYGIRYRDVKGIIVNSFIELQPYSMKALKEGLYILDHPTPPAYPVGPLLSIKSTYENQQQQQHECIQWLNGQPPRSVVFLCFGSMGSFSRDQVTEIAIGLERCGHRFLWALRSPPTEPRKAFGQQPTDAIPNEVLPEGSAASLRTSSWSTETPCVFISTLSIICLSLSCRFLERTMKRGMVLPTFAPQKEILGHEAVGGFVTHCGWNSTMESLWFGVPMLTWPLYAEQHFNAFEMVEEMGVAVRLKIDRKAGNWAAADDIERGVRCLMGGEGNKVRSKAMEMSKMARRTLEEGGSSFLFMENLLEAMALKNNSI